MNKRLLLAILGILVVGSLFLMRGRVPEPLGGREFSFYSVTSATSTVNPYTWTRIATTTPDMGFYNVCDDGGPIDPTYNVYLAFMATTTIPNKPYGLRLAPGECYRMTQQENNMFYGWIYALASSSTTTLLQIYK